MLSRRREGFGLLHPKSLSNAHRQVPLSTMSADVVSRQSQAEALKDKGNEEFKRGNYEVAVQHYTDASRLVPSSSVYFANRAMAYIKLSKYASIPLYSWHKGQLRMSVVILKMCMLRYWNAWYVVLDELLLIVHWNLPN